MNVSLKRHWILVLIFLIGFIFRLYQLDKIPVGVHGDEASIGYNAYSLLKTQRDQNGKFLPIAIDQFGDFRPAGYHYLAIPFVAVLDLNALSTRLPGALAGAALVIVFYLLLCEIFKSKNIALTGSALLAISPWHIVISRATSEGVVAALFILLATYLYFRSLRSKSHTILFLAFSLFLYFVSFLFYHSARFFVPAFLLPLALLTLFQINKSRKLIVYFILFYFLLIIALFSLFTFGAGSNRPHDISMLNIPGGTTQLQQQINEDGIQNPLITRFFHNKLFFYSRLFAISYFQHFDGEFLFITNGYPIRYRIPWTGNMHIIELPFLLFGFAVLLGEGIKNKKYLYLLPLAWLFLAAIPSGLTWEDIPNVQRSSLMIYGLLAITAFGINELFSLVRGRIKQVMVGVTAIIFLHNILYFSHNYFYHSPIHEPWHRSAGEEDLVFSLASMSKNYKQVIMTTDHNNNLIHHLFYLKFDPKEYIAMGSPRESEGLKFQKLVLTGRICPLEGDPQSPAKVEPGILYVNNEGCKLPKNANIIKTVRTPDGVPAFHFVELLSTSE